MAISKVVQEKIGQMLVEEGIISNEQLRVALEEQKKRGWGQKPLGDFIVELGFATEKDILKVVGLQFNLPVMELKGITVEKNVLNIVSEAIAHRFKMIPLFLLGNELTVAITDPTRFEVMDALANETKCKIIPVLALDSEIENALAFNYTEKLEKQLDHSINLYQYEVDREGPSESERLKRAGKEIPIVKIVDKILAHAAEESASDIHIEPGVEQLTIRLRIDGILSEAFTFSMSLHAAIVSRIKILSQLDISERWVPQDGRIQMSIQKKSLDMRVSTLPTCFGEKVVMRLLDKKNSLLGLEQMGFSKGNLETFRFLIRQPYGIILITGPTGSGKTTTLYAALNEVRSVEKNIITVEDPVEYQIPTINQVPVNPKRDVTFANALRAILRQDPNIIMIGEIRDRETGKIATESALTGHLVFSTLHTNDSPGAVTRLMEMGIEPYLLAPSLLGVVAQRLARKICGNCREAYSPTRVELETMGLIHLGKDIPFYKGKGCKTCNQKGYKGRVGVFEILVVDETIRELILAKASANTIRGYGWKKGFRDMRFDGVKKVVAGLTSVEEVLRMTRGTELVH
jgi:type IV pilus assembly protein PilB